MAARIAAIVLAAGRSSRFGSPKMLANLDGEPLLLHAVRMAMTSGADETIVVTRSGDDALKGSVELPTGARWVSTGTDDPPLSVSLSTGLSATSPEVEAALVFLGDQPRIPSEAIGAVLAAHRLEPSVPIRPSYRGTPGHPVLLPRLCWRELPGSGEDGARTYLGSHRHRLVRLDLDPPPDVDEPSDIPDGR